jgi:hypothetical protein
MLIAFAGQGQLIVLISCVWLSICFIGVIVMKVLEVVSMSLQRLDYINGEKSDIGAYVT